MTEEFHKSGTNAAVSSLGFTVSLNGHGGMTYSDRMGDVQIDTEWLFKPFRILVYGGSHRGNGLEGRAPGEVDAMYKSLTRALQYLGYVVEMPSAQMPNQLPDPTSPSVTPPAGAGGAPSVAADH
jgi:hypothetical protein